MFITVEGQDGSGKTTQIQTIVSVLESFAKEVVVTREPGGTPLAEELRKLLLHTHELSSRTEALLANAARCDHVEKVIQPALDAGKWVISDRYVHSTLAYQCGGLGLYRSIAQDLHQIATRGTMPDLTLLFDVDPEVGKSRMGGRALDKFEEYQLDFVRRVREAYLRLAVTNSRIFVIDANQSMEHVAESVRKVVTEFVTDVTRPRRS